MSVRLWVLLLVLITAGGIVAGVYITWDTSSRQTIAPSQDKAKNATIRSGGPDEERQSILMDEDAVDISAEGIELTQGAAGQLEWKLEARQGRYDQLGGTVHLSFPRVRYYIADGVEQSEVVVQAETGNVDQGRNIIHLSQNVTGRYEDFSMATSDLIYNGTANEITLEGGVSLSKAGMEINASQVTVDPETRDIFAHEDVVAWIAAERFEKTEPPADATVQANATESGTAEREPMVVRSLEGLVKSKEEKSPASMKKTLDDLVEPKKNSLSRDVTRDSAGGIE